MTNDLARKQMCIVMRDGTEIWADQERAEKIGNDWVRGLKASIKVEQRFVNTVDIAAILLPEDMENKNRKRQGQWKCQHDKWQAKDSVHCTCMVRERDERGWNKI